MISLTNITKEYDVGEQKAKVLKNINLKIKEKEFIGIIGPSGCGKSTLMHILGLLDTPTFGEIKIFDKNVSKLSDNELSSLRNQFVGFVFQQFNLINKLTVLENVLLPATYSSKKMSYDPKQKAHEILEKFGLSERTNFFPNKISGGQQQRVAIARALIMNPRLILADEPTGNLDSKTGQDILGLLETLNNDFGVTVVIVTHDKEVASRTKKKIFMKDGEIVTNHS